MWKHDTTHEKGNFENCKHVNTVRVCMFYANVPKLHVYIYIYIDMYICVSHIFIYIYIYTYTCSTRTVRVDQTSARHPNPGFPSNHVSCSGRKDSARGSGCFFSTCFGLGFGVFQNVAPKVPAAFSLQAVPSGAHLRVLHKGVITSCRLSHTSSTRVFNACPTTCQPLSAACKP